MLKLGVAFCLLFSVGMSFARSDVPAFAELEADGPIAYRELDNSRIASPFMTAYDPGTKTCILVSNIAFGQLNQLAHDISSAHEAGHCVLLRAAIINIDDGASRLGETFADVYAIAWMYYNKPERFEEAVNWLVERRVASRRISASYDTIAAIYRAKRLLAPGKTPAQFTLELFANEPH